MKRKSLYSVGLLIGSLSLMSASGAMAADYKIGVVNALKVLESAPQAETAKSKLEREFASRDKELLAQQKALRDMEDRLGKDGAIMSETERTSLERDILNKRRDLKRAQDEFREDVNFRRNEEFGKIQKQIVEAIKSEAEEKQYDLILGEGVVFAGPKVDITNDVIKRLTQ